jgi:hypothetical protein
MNDVYHRTNSQWEFRYQSDIRRREVNCRPVQSMKQTLQQPQKSENIFTFAKSLPKTVKSFK